MTAVTGMLYPYERVQMILVLMGPPGSGKGTQGARIAEGYGLPKISTGEIFRDLAAAGTPLGLEAKRYSSQGLLVPDEIVIGLLRERVTAPDCESGFILDGFPRTVQQAETLDCLLAQMGRRLVGVLNFDVYVDELVRRLSGRRTCGNCGATYHVTSMPSRKEGVCDHCGSPLTQRVDDSPESIRRRLVEYEAKTAPVLAYYAGRGILTNIDSNTDPDTIFGRVGEALREFAGAKRLLSSVD